MEATMKPAAWGWGTTGPAALLRRLAGKREAAEAMLRVEERVSLGPKKWLVLVNCRGQRVLLALSGDTVTPVMELEPPTQPGPKPARRRARGESR